MQNLFGFPICVIVFLAHGTRIDISGGGQNYLVQMPGKSRNLRPDAEQWMSWTEMPASATGKDHKIAKIEGNTEILHSNMAHFLDIR
jgi:hypothetical protein